MTFSFGVQKLPIYGTYGEFTIGTDFNKIKSQFLLTKMKPGSEGSWENALASQMVPWREIFDIEELTFDELLQRDLDDSRVAHDLIPYLLGESGANARFFPPVLAVLAPKKQNRSGISEYYPTPTLSESSSSFGDLFDFEKIILDGQNTPLGVIKYNQQKTAFIIVDGQHRAMALLALHRQINQSWSGNRYAAYYNHLSLQEQQVCNIELPICIVFFPELHQDNPHPKERGIDLKSVCREIFLVVNKTAKRVSQSRELLLDDEDFAARMMRETLSKLKGRGENDSSLARIYSFAFGDTLSDSQTRKAEVVAGQLEYSSAVALHKMHSAVSFGVPTAFKLEQTKDITDGRSTQNSDRPASILLGTSLQKWKTLSRRSGKYHPPYEVQTAVTDLSRMTDEVIIDLFDKFRPFSIHNNEMRNLRTRLQDPSIKSDLIQAKCFSLLFEGSGVRSVFEEHINRLKDRKDSFEEEGKTVSDYIQNQLQDAQTTLNAVNRHEEEIKQKRAAKFFYVDYDKFFASAENEQERKRLLAQARTIFDTVSTQAFQLGYLMTVHSVVELMTQFDAATTYDQRLKLIRFINNLYINALNTYFSSPTESEHRTLTGFFNEPRVNVFNPKAKGLRGLLAQSVKELNESQWIFFRYAILEIVHCKHGYKSVRTILDQPGIEPLCENYRKILPELIASVFRLREAYIQKAVDTRLNSNEFKQELLQLKWTLSGEGKLEAHQIEQEETRKKDTEEKAVREQSQNHLYASLGESSKSQALVVNRLFNDANLNEDADE